ncbi:hypothetical protein HHK36_013520 [Tetracentron sinense]|uniref:Uncharacterized protein n=1 Tax=Tetracentron sinense TaxID=13715 RepID=A0A834Z8B3_TETSI|nr:hypothetical protein HHK36_013520 [Tetracentron sinense]
MASLPHVPSSSFALALLLLFSTLNPALADEFSAELCPGKGYTKKSPPPPPPKSTPPSPGPSPPPSTPPTPPPSPTPSLYPPTTPPSPNPTSFPPSIPPTPSPSPTPPPYIYVPSPSPTPNCFRESEQINVGNVWIVGSDGSEEEEQEAFVERIESKNEYFETAEFHLVSVEEYLLG